MQGEIIASQTIAADPDEPPVPTNTLSPGTDSMVGAIGAGGAGGATMGGGGASGAGNGGAAVAPQLDPMCFGSPGGTVYSPARNIVGGHRWCRGRRAVVGRD